MEYESAMEKLGLYSLKPRQEQYQVIGPITDPCGTPEITGAGSDRSPLTITVWCLPVRNECSYLLIFPSIPSHLSLARVILKSSLLNAFAKSSYMTSTFLPFY